MELDRREKDLKREQKWGSVKDEKTFLSLSVRNPEDVNDIEDLGTNEVIYQKIDEKKTLMDRKRNRARRVERYIQQEPQYTWFKPSWIPANKLEQVVLLVDEYEAMRWCDVKWLSMQAWAEKMWISAPTFNRMVISAHKKVADAIVYGKWIRVCTSEKMI